MLLFINETIQFPDGKGYLPTLPQLLHECGDIQYLCYASYLFATFVQDRKTFFYTKERGICVGKRNPIGLIAAQSV